MRLRFRFCLSAGGLLSLLFGFALATSAGDRTDVELDWPRWRGPRGDGTWQGPLLPEKWPDGGLERVWRDDIGGGYAGVSVVDGRVYTMDRLKEPDEMERVLCWDAVTGKRLWTFPYEVKYGNLDYGNGPRGMPTIHDGRLYALGALGHLHCLDAATGKRLWSAHLVDDLDGIVPMWGYAAAPLVFGELLVVIPGGKNGSSIVALDRKSGREVWRSLSDPAGYAAPVRIERAGREELIYWTPTHVRGLDLISGESFWNVPYEITYGVAIALPIYQENIVLVAGYWDGSKAIRLGEAPGDAKLIWEDRLLLRGLMSQPLYRDGYCYLLDKQYGLTCFELQTGKKLWDDDNRMTPRGRNPQANLVWTGEGDRAIILNAEGELILARLNPKGYEEQSRTKIIGPTWAHPAYSGTRAYARDDVEIVCVELGE